MSSETEEFSKALIEIRDFFNRWDKLIYLLAAATAGILALIFGENITQTIGYVLTPGLIIIAIVIWNRIRKIPRKESRVESNQNQKTFFRGLYSFNEDDILPGSQRVLLAQQIFTQISDKNFRFAIISGDSGAGKSSLFKAGVNNLLKRAEKTILLIDSPINNLFGKNLTEKLNSLKGLVDENKPLNFLLIDQFEELLINWQDIEDRKSIGTFLNDLIINEKIKIVVCLRKDYLLDLNDLSPELPDPLNGKYIFTIKNLTLEQAREIIDQCCKSDHIRMTDSLNAIICDDLIQSNFIRPAELQIVCTSLVNSGYSIENYRLSGGVKGILASHIQELIKLFRDTELAKKLLRTLCDFSINAKNPPKNVQQIKIEINLDNNFETHNKIIEILSRYEESRLINLRTTNGETEVSLVHDYIVPAIDQATRDISTQQERADQELKFYLAQFNNGVGVIPSFKKINFLKQHASKTLVTGSEYRRFIRHAYNRIILRSFGYISIILIIAFVWGLLTTEIVWKEENSLIYSGPGDKNLDIQLLAKGQMQTCDSFTILYSIPVEDELMEQFYRIVDIRNGNVLFEVKGRISSSYPLPDFYNLNRFILFKNTTDSLNIFFDKQTNEQFISRLPNYLTYYDLDFLDENDVILYRQQSTNGVYINSDTVVLWSIKNDTILKTLVNIKFHEKNMRYQNISEGISSSRILIDNPILVRGPRPNWSISRSNPFIYDLLENRIIFNLKQNENSKILSFCTDEKIEFAYTIDSVDGSKYLCKWDLRNAKFSESVKIRDVYTGISLVNDDLLKLHREAVRNTFGSYKANDKHAFYKTNNLRALQEIPEENRSFICGDFIIWQGEIDTNVSYFWDCADHSKIIKIDNFNFNGLKSFSFEDQIEGDKIVYTRDKKYLVSVKGNSLQFWDIYSGALKAEVTPALAINSIKTALYDNNAVQVNLVGGNVLIFDIRTGDQIAELLNIGGDKKYVFFKEGDNKINILTDENKFSTFKKGRRFLWWWFPSNN